MKKITVILLLAMFASCVAPRGTVAKTGPIPKIGDTITQCKKLVVYSVKNRKNGTPLVKCLTLVKQ